MSKPMSTIFNTLVFFALAVAIAYAALHGMDKQAEANAQSYAEYQLSIECKAYPDAPECKIN